MRNYIAGVSEAAEHRMTDPSDAQLLRVLGGMPTAVCLLDADWQITYVNTEAERVIGRPREDLLGRNHWELFPATVGSPFETNYRRAVASGQPVVFEAFYPEPLNAWYQVNASPSAEGLSVYFIDVTARHSRWAISESTVLSADAQASRQARTLTKDVCRRANVDEELCDTAVLLTSELVTNATSHGRSAPRITLRAGPDRVRVEVGDDNSRFPVVVPDDPDALDGRGMALVQSCADEWGVTPEPGGKVVWFEIQRH